MCRIHLIARKTKHRLCLCAGPYCGVRRLRVPGPVNKQTPHSLCVCVQKPLVVSEDSECLDQVAQRPHQASPYINANSCLLSDSLAFLPNTGCVSVQEPLVVSEDSECLDQMTCAQNEPLATHTANRGRLYLQDPSADPLGTEAPVMTPYGIDCFPSFCRILLWCLRTQSA